MKPRRYSDFVIINEVYCNSLGGYSFFGFCNAGCFEWQDGTVLMPGKRYWRFVEWPKYAHAAIKALIADGIQRGGFKVYECDQDGNRRFDGLRYHDADHFVARYSISESEVHNV